MSNFDIVAIVPLKNNFEIRMRVKYVCCYYLIYFNLQLNEIGDYNLRTKTRCYLISPFEKCFFNKI